MSRHLLPPNRTPLEAALADSGAFVLDPSVLAQLADSARCPVNLLPWLAWERSVDNVDAAATEAQQRALIRSSLDVHRHKGTVAAVRQVFRTLGLGEVTLEEGRAGLKRDGSRRRIAFYKRGTAADGWAEYRVIFYTRVTVQQAALARALLADIAPQRCHLFELDFSQAALVRNGYAKRDGRFTRGST